MKRPTLFLLLGILFLIPPAIAAAQGLVPCNGPECQACDLVSLADNILDFLVMISAFIAAIMFAVAGLKLATSAGNESKVSQAKEGMTSIIIGFIILLAAWLIVDTIMKTFTTGQGRLGTWNDIECVRLPEYKETSMDELPNDPAVYSGAMGVGDLVLSDDAVARLNAAGIGVKPGAGLDGLQPHVLDQVIRLNQTCNCNVLITEGTKGTHQTGTFSHGNGFKLDLRTRDNPELVGYVKSLPSAGAWKDGTQLFYDSASCGTYAVEGDHVDVVYRPSC